MQTKTIKIKSNNIFGNRRQPQFFEKGRRPSKKIMQPKTIKIKNNGCGTAPGNLVVLYKEVSLVKIIWAIFGYLLLNL